jgi:hypothetical protein
MLVVAVAEIAQHFLWAEIIALLTTEQVAAEVPAALDPTAQAA